MNKMEGGNYITIFPNDDNRKTRVFLYKLENLGIVKCESRSKNKWCIHTWSLTDRGKILIGNYVCLQPLWQEERIQEFYEAIENLSKQQEFIFGPIK